MNNTIGVFHRNPDQCTVKFNPQERAAQLKAYREFYSGQEWDCRGFSYEGKEPTGSPGYARGDIRKFIAEGGTDGFKPRFTHILGGHKGGGSKSCGIAVQGGQDSTSFDEFGCTSDTTLHECVGHNGLGDGSLSKTGCGLGHSHRLRNGKISNMGDHSSLMGAGDGQGLLSAHIVCLGWNRPEETIVVEESATVKIAPVEMAGLHLNEYKHVIIRGKPDLYLSTRLNYPYLCDRTAPRERLYLHEFYPHGHPSIPGDFPNTTLRLPDLMPGEAMHGSVTVRYVAWDEGIATVEITMEQTHE